MDDNGIKNSSRSDMQEQNDRTGLEVAVIGMAGRFPGAIHTREFWNNVKNGVESITLFKDEELEVAGVDPTTLSSSNYVKAKGILEDADYFDASFFNYTTDEASLMNPQTRLFHECSWEALEDAGYAPGDSDGTIGIYAGSNSDFEWIALFLLSARNSTLGQYNPFNLIDKDSMCQLVAYNLNLTGPAFTVRAGCSTSTVAIHLACQGLISGECHMALAGGVSLHIKQKSGYFYQEDGFDSPDGHTRSFDAAAKGTAYGEGIGIVLLKPLEEAENDGDHIYAVIKGTAVNHDGSHKVGYSAPSIKGQAAVIRAAHRAAGINPETIGYVEAHGTGTPLGDAVEIEALKQAFNTNKRNFCAVAAVKSNIGNLGAASGVTAFIKAALALKYKLIPPGLNFEIPNPRIDFENSPFYVNKELTEWKNRKYPLRAGVNSFAVGGTNVHVILEEWPGDRPQTTDHRPQGTDEKEYHLLLLSAKTETALDKITENLVEYLKNHPQANLADVAYTLQTGRKAFKHRRLALCTTVDNAIHVLSSPGTGCVHDFVLKENDTTAVNQPNEDISDFRHSFEKLEKIGRLWLHGKEIDWDVLYADKRWRLSLPTYPFAGQQFPADISLFKKIAQLLP